MRVWIDRRVRRGCRCRRSGSTCRSVCSSVTYALSSVRSLALLHLQRCPSSRGEKTAPTMSTPLPTDLLKHSMAPTMALTMADGMRTPALAAATMSPSTPSPKRRRRRVSARSRCRPRVRRPRVDSWRDRLRSCLSRSSLGSRAPRPSSMTPSTRASTSRKASQQQQLFSLIAARAATLPATLPAALAQQLSQQLSQQLAQPAPFVLVGTHRIRPPCITTELPPSPPPTPIRRAGTPATHGWSAVGWAVALEVW